MRGIEGGGRERRAVVIAQPLYFLPDLRASAAESVALRKGVLKERGLADVFADVPQDQQPLWELSGRGPGNKSGCLMYAQASDGAVPRRTGYLPDEQRWTPVGDGSLLWLGIDTAEPPKPEEMARRKQYGGYRLELGDGQSWLIPIIRRPDGSTELPTDMVWDATGRLIEPVKAQYQALWAETAEVATWFFDGVEPDRGRALECAIKALALNYRFGRNEQNLLRVIDSENLMLVLAAMIDATSAPKKSPDLATNAPPGCEDSAPVTDQAAGICT